MENKLNNSLNVRLQPGEIDALRKCFELYFLNTDHLWDFGYSLVSNTELPIYKVARSEGIQLI